MTTSVRLDPSKNIRDVVVRNVLGGDGPWILINLKADPVVVMASNKLKRDQWIDAISALEDQAVEAQDTVSQPVK